MQLDIDAYLQRIDYHGDRSPTLETLRALHRAHLLSVPFENLNIGQGWPILTTEQVLFQKIGAQFNGQLPGKTIAVWGLAFKPMTDDMREAPSVALINALLDAGAKVQAYDPVARGEAQRLFQNRIELTDNPYEAAKGADGLAILTEWNEFRSPDFQALKENLKNPVIFDGRNLYNPESLQQEGFVYCCIGKKDPS